jgi:hypothetical protein
LLVAEVFRELNELNYARFEAKLKQRLSIIPQQQWSARRFRACVLAQGHPSAAVRAALPVVSP